MASCGMVRHHAAQRARCQWSNERVIPEERTMPAKYTPPPAPPASSSDIEARIASERARLPDEQNLEKELDTQRAAALEAGDDEALDGIESQLNACCERQFRIQERIEILEVRRTEAVARENDEQNEEIVRRANRAREHGEWLIRNDYAKHAAALADTLMDLAAINQYIQSANARLNGTDRKGVPGPNQIRSAPRKEWEEPVRIQVHVNDLRHPHYGNALVSACHPELASLDGGSGKQIPSSTEIVVTERHSFGPVHKCELTEAVVLPEVEPDQPGRGTPPFWDPNFVIRRRAEIQARMEEIEARITSEIATGSASKASARSRNGAKAGEPA
jgi:hypothetical protein